MTHLEQVQQQERIQQSFNTILEDMCQSARITIQHVPTQDGKSAGVVLIDGTDCIREDFEAYVQTIDDALCAGVIFKSPSVATFRFLGIDT